MADFTFTRAMYLLGTGGINFTTDSLRVILCMTNTNVLTAGIEDATTLSGIALDEFDGSAYTRQILANVTWTQDNTNNYAVLDSDDVVFGSLGNSTPGTRQVKGYIIAKHVTDDTDSPPLFWKDSGTFPFSSNGLDFTIQHAAAGIFRLRRPT